VDDEHRFGVIDSDDTPGGSGAVFAVIQAEGHRTLRPGQLVRFRFIAARQDDYDFQVVEVIPTDT
jgi:CspA family cold shock protein